MERVNGGGSGATNPFSKKEETKMMEQIRNLNLDRIDLDDAVGMLAFANVVSATYAEMKMEPPAWFTDKRGSLSGYVEQRRKENLTKAAKEIKAELNKLKTAEEKRSELNARLKEIEAAMASK